ncbi:MAG: DUF192 domain-containing protein [Proteobacteria bacterium]|nr:DUF192 domain-containing protein [Pseudomonadota bacterium]MCP4920794.1 DUF192 domain-containing protein [Pseudomonadota bacterium]
MKRVTVHNRTRDVVLADAALHATGFFERMQGLLGREVGPGMVIEPCNSVHTLFMSDELDLVFASGEHEVLRCVEALVPWRFSPIVSGARYVVELPAGVIASTGTAAGHRLELA